MPYGVVDYQEFVVPAANLGKGWLETMHESSVVTCQGWEYALDRNGRKYIRMNSKFPWAQFTGVLPIPVRDQYLLLGLKI